MMYDKYYEKIEHILGWFQRFSTGNSTGIKPKQSAQKFR